MSDYLTAITLPAWSPLFPYSMIRFEDCTRVVMLGRLKPGVTKSITPFPLEPMGDFILISWLRMGAVLGLPPRNNISFSIPCKYENEIGKYCTLEYTSTGFGLAAGRELGGWPKKDGVFKWEETEEGVTVEVSRYGHVLARTKASFQASDVDARKWPEEFNVPEYGSCNLQVRHLAKTVADEPELAEVVKTDYPNFESSVSIAIDSTFELSNGPLDEFNILGDIDILSARYEKSSFDFDISRSIGVHKLR
ncbi:acetoacetate decarboxylase family protein [Pandoraea sp. B-6]|uniref:acetoacetate decarboxylase family protein n=1 Tax=Pandoraea sp. B-6 TaxID=1204340 RepID=UPI0003634999